MANEYLKRTPTSTGNRKVWTWSGWVKRNQISNGSVFYTSQTSTPYLSVATFNADNTIEAVRSESATVTELHSESVFRDPGSWKHILISFDTTKSTESERTKLYVNGVLYPFDSSANYASLNYEAGVNRIVEHNIGIIRNTSTSVVNPFLGELFDLFFVDGQALTPDVFGFYKDGDGYMSSGTTEATDFRPGQWSPRAPKSIKYTINRSGGFGVNGFYLPMNDSSNPGADFHCAPNSIIKLKGEDLPQPQNGAPTTSDAYVSQLRSDPFAANLVLAIPGITGGQGSGYGDYSADIKGSGSNKTVTSPTPSAVFSFSSYYGSALVFDVFDGNYLSIPNNSDFNFSGGEDFTVELWYYRQVDNTTEALIGVFENSSARRAWQLESRANASLRFQWWADGSSAGGTIDAQNSAVPKDQWHHICVERSGDTITVYVNGVSVGVDITAGSIYNNTTDPLRIGMLNAAGDLMLTGRLQDVRVYKGVAKYKGGFDVPKPYTPVGIESWRTTADTCKNNFATLNPLYRHVSSNTYTNGNLKAVANSNDQVTTGNMAFSSGKWYWETRIFNDEMTGLAIPSRYIAGYPGSNTNAFSYHQSGNVYYNGTTNYGVGWPGSTYRVIGFAVDWTNRRAYWSVDGVWHNSADPSAGTGFYDITVTAPNVAASVDALPAWRTRSANASEQVSVNFGQNPSFGGELTAGTFTDDSGKGLFKYAPPTGFLALCEDNLPTPAIADPGKHFKTVLWTGDGNNGRSITGVGFKPDFVWIKNRANGAVNSWHSLSNSITPGRLFSNDTSAEDSFKDVGSFDNDGMSINYGSYVNTSGGTYVAWCWKAGGAAVSNTDGTITSQVSANQDAGFSIVSYTGNGTAGANVGHGLLQAPELMIHKSRDQSRNWYTITTAVDGSPDYLYLNLDNQANDSAVTAPTSSLMYLTSSAESNNLNEDYIAYCWHSVENYSRIGIYYGNDSDDGSFIYCGFKPAFVMTKRFDSSSNWLIHDSTRDPVNPVMGTLWGNLDNIEGRSNVIIDMLSNGFKHRNSDGGVGNNRAIPAEYIFVAFAESPFQTANAK